MIVSYRIQAMHLAFCGRLRTTPSPTSASSWESASHVAKGGVKGIFRRMARPRRGPLGMRQAIIFKLRHYLASLARFAHKRAASGQGSDAAQ